MSDAALGACEDATLSRARPVVIKVDARARVGVLMAPGTALLPANLRDGTLWRTVSTHTKWMTQSPARSQRQREGVSSCHSCTAGGLVCLCKRAGSEQPPVTISDQPRGTRRDSMLGRKAAAAPQCVGLPRCRLARVVEEEPAQLHRSAHLRRALRVWPLVTDRRDERREFHSFVSHN